MLWNVQLECGMLVGLGRGELRVLDQRPIGMWNVLKGEVRRFFLFVQSFYRPKTKTTFNRQFSPKSPKMGQKSGQRVQNSQNKDLTVNSGFRPTVGIHQFWLPTYCGNPSILASDLLWESIYILEWIPT